jgi:Xaa-Pro dipeptidase
MSVSRRRFIRDGALAAASLDILGKRRFGPEFGRVSPELSPELQNLVANVAPLAAQDYERRIEKARRLMAGQGLDALFVGGGTNLVYFTKVSWWLSERLFGVLLGPQKPPVWISPAFELARAQELVPAGQEVRIWEEHENPYKLIAGVLADWGVASGRLALAPDLRSFEVFGLRKNCAPAEVVDGAVVTEGCRGVKSEKEIAFLDLANRITKLAYREGFKSLREGMSPSDLAGPIASAHQALGAPGGGGPQFGPNTAFPHGSQTARTLRPGDAVLVDGGCAVQGYRSDVTRTVVFGAPSDKQRRVWDIVKRAQTAALRAARPGATCESVDQAARKVIEDAGFGPDYKFFAHRLGHGIGLDGHEYPYLVRGNTLKLEPGMTFSDEPGIYIYGEFGVRIEDCMVVTEDGGRILGGMEAVALERPFGE